MIMKESVFFFHLPTEIFFGIGALDNLNLEFSNRGWRSALVITDQGIPQTGLLSKLEDVLKASNVEYKVYDGVVPNPTVKVIEEARRSAKSFDPDVLIGFGGGSSLDAAKVVNILKVHGGTVFDYEGGETVPGPCGPIVAIPTTAGTGSEVTQFAVVSDPKRKVKMAIASKFIMPTLAVVDPTLSATMPHNLTAATGMDALTHAIESMTSLAEQPITDALSLKAIRLINENLPKAVQEGSDLEARAKMAFASLIAGISLSNSYVGIAHSIAHALGGLYALPHGVCCALALPVAMEYNLDVKRHKYEQIAQAFGVSTAEEGIEKVRKLNDEIGMPRGLKAMGVREDEIEKIAERALADGSTLFNPRQPTKEEVIELIRKIF